MKSVAAGWCSLEICGFGGKFRNGTQNRKRLIVGRRQTSHVLVLPGCCFLRLTVSRLLSKRNGQPILEPTEHALPAGNKLAVCMRRQRAARFSFFLSGDGPPRKPNRETGRPVCAHTASARRNQIDLALVCELYP